METKTMPDDKWIGKAVAKGKGDLRKKLGVKGSSKITRKELTKAKHSSSPKMRKEAVLAETLKSLAKKKKK